MNKRFNLKRNIKPSHIPITVVSLCFGGMIAFLLSANMSGSKIVKNTTDMNRDQLLVQYMKLSEENAKLLEETEIMRLRIDNFLNDQLSDPDVQAQVDELRVLAGTTALKGPGITITLDDTKNSGNPSSPDASLMVVHDSDLYVLVNELKSSGAEAVEINGQRVGATTAIRCAGPIIQVNSTSIAPPFVINAIGDPDILYGGMNFPNGTLSWLKTMEIDVKVEKKNEIVISALKVKPTLVNATVVTADKESNTQSKKGAK